MSTINNTDTDKIEKEIVRCYGCKKRLEKVLKCGRCGYGRYCSKECQKRCWPTHKLQCIADSEVATMMEKECRLVTESDIFAQLAACTRRYNEELKKQDAQDLADTGSKDVEGYGRRVGGIVTIQSSEQMPPSLRGHGEILFSVSFGDLADEDKDKNGDGSWEFSLTPSRGNGKFQAKIQVTSIPELNEDKYKEFRDSGVFEGERKIVAYAGVSTIPTPPTNNTTAINEDKLKLYPFPFKQEWVTIPEPLRDIKLRDFVARYRQDITKLAIEGNEKACTLLRYEEENVREAVQPGDTPQAISERLTTLESKHREVVKEVLKVILTSASTST